MKEVESIVHLHVAGGANGPMVSVVDLSRSSDQGSSPAGRLCCVLRQDT